MSLFDDVAGREGISPEKFDARVRDGSIVVMRNACRDIVPVAVGAGCMTKVNANVGTSEKSSIMGELEKARAAVEYGADAVMDLSVGDGMDETRQKILEEIKVPVGTVPVYQMFINGGGDVTLESMLKVIEKHCSDGVDFVTIHCGITKDIVGYFEERLIPVTSRGGSFLAAWMRENHEENPLYSGFDSILEILKEHEVTLSLGDALRPACLHDASDRAQIQELVNLGHLTKRARSAGVKVIIEGPGHVPLDQIEMNVKLQKRLCDNAPFYVLGPLVTDIALGYDHITSAIGGAVAAMHGADFLCYVTPSEHLGLPGLEDVKNGVIASRIAAHAADIVKRGDRERDDAMSRARFNLDWDGMFRHCLDPHVREKYPDLKGHDVCTMCSSYCALKIFREKRLK